MRRAAPFAVVATCCAAALGAVGSLTLASSDAPAGVPATGPVLSADGRRVVYATALSPGGPTQLVSREAGSTRSVLVSSGVDGLPADRGVDTSADRPPYSTSFDGRFVVFASAAGNLVSGVVAGVRHVYRKDLETGRIVLVDRGPNGEPPESGVLGQPDVSADGNRVVFATGPADDLFVGDANRASDVVVRDIRTARTLTLGSEQPRGAATRPAISADGRVVAFEIDAASDNLVPGDVDGAPEIVLATVGQGAARALAPGEGALADAPRLGDVSGDGGSVVFESEAPRDPADRNTVPDVYLARPADGAPVRLVSRTSAGASGNGPSSAPTVTADGTAIAFLTAATDLDPGDLNGVAADVVVAGRTLVRESTRPSGAPPPGPVAAPAIAASGAALAFTYDDGAGPFVPGDADGAPDVVVRERAPTDAHGPILVVRVGQAGVGAAGRRRQVTGTVADPSGVATLTIASRPVRISAGGAFAVGVTLPGELPLVAVDGAGNRTERIVAATPVRLPAYASVSGGQGPRARLLTAAAAGRAMRVSFLLEGAAPVRVLVERRTGRSWVRVGELRRRLGAGRHRLLVPSPRLGRGVVRVRVAVAGTGVRQATTVLTVR